MVKEKLKNCEENDSLLKKKYENEFPIQQKFPKH